MWWSKGVGQVRFTFEGRRHSFGTGERDPQRAAARAAQLYADFVAGRWRPAPRVGGKAEPLGELVDAYLEHFAKGRPRGGSVATVRLLFKRHLVPFFGDLSKLETGRIAAYQAERLTKVSRRTVLNESSCLRGFLAWMKQTGLAIEVPEVPHVPERMTGTRAQPRRRTELSPGEVARVLAELPERTVARKRDNEVLFCRAYFEVLYETGLRPSTVAALSVPEHWRPGRKHLEVTPDIDKARFGRPVPLSARAVAALERAHLGPGLLFGRHDFKVALERACARAGVPRCTPYDFRRGRATHLVEATGNLPGVAYLLGHKELTTTNKYARPNERAARDVLAFDAPRSGSDSGSEKK